MLINTGTELLLGDVQDAHLAFIAREILPLGLRIEERRTVPDSDVIRRTLTELFSHCEILFVTGGLGPTTDDITREMVAESLGLALHQDEFGKPLCPCNFYPDKADEVKRRRWICACDEMQAYKYCH